jgi:hypothetical protein
MWLCMCLCMWLCISCQALWASCGSCCCGKVHRVWDSGAGHLCGLVCCCNPSSAAPPQLCTALPNTSQLLSNRRCCCCCALCAFPIR